MNVTSEPFDVTIVVVEIKMKKLSIFLIFDALFGNLTLVAEIVSRKTFFLRHLISSCISRKYLS